MTMTGFWVPAAHRAVALPIEAAVPIPVAAEAYRAADPIPAVGEAFLRQPVRIRKVETARHPAWHRS